MAVVARGERHSSAISFEHRAIGAGAAIDDIVAAALGTAPSVGVVARAEVDSVGAIAGRDIVLAPPAMMMSVSPVGKGAGPVDVTVGLTPNGEMSSSAAVPMNVLPAMDCLVWLERANAGPPP
ncbi:MAG TPA: hypothetical protein PKA74_13575 [Bauldia sp.]|nr:hypothetical protein [Bauldia sp.]